MKIPGASGRPVAVLLGAVLLGAVQAGGAVAGGGPAVAGTRGAGHPPPRVAALALLRHRGLGMWVGPGRGRRAPALAGGGRHVPQPGDGGELFGVFCTSSANCWAVGTYGFRATEVELNEILHWNGSAWSTVSVPSPGGTAAGDVSTLLAVRCTARRNCWAVGFSRTVNQAEFNQALHWNGRKWSLVRTPQPGGTLAADSSALFDVTCLSSANCWAVGDNAPGPGNTSAVLNQALHWNGRRWTLVRTPQPGGTAANDSNTLNGVRCPSATTCLAVGSTGMLTSPFAGLNEVLRWNGRKWSNSSVPSPGGPPSAGGFSELIGLTCASPTTCWAVGDYGTFATPATFFSQILHWNGRRWSQATIPEPGGTGSGASQALVGATCSSATNCWAVGHFVPSGGDTVATLNLALHWDGTTWSQAFTPDPGGTNIGDISALNAVRCPSAANCWAVGEAGSIGVSVVNQALNWDGTIWSPG